MALRYFTEDDKYIGKFECFSETGTLVNLYTYVDGIKQGDFEVYELE